MKVWIGKSLVVIGVIHTVVGVLLSSRVLGDMLREGLINTVVMQDDRNAAFWFLFGGVMLLLSGWLVDHCERAVGTLPRMLGPSFLALTIAGIVIMPQSGFWLLLIPTVGMLRRTRRQPA